MATVSLYSTQITNRDASPRALTNSSIVKAQVYSSIGVIESSAADDIGSVYYMCTVPSNARMSALKLSCDSTGTTGTADIGLYQTTANGSAVVDADFFASAQALTTALKNSDVMLESGVFDPSEMEQPLWETLGLSADPKIDYDICLTLTEATVSAASIALEALYVV